MMFYVLCSFLLIVPCLSQCNVPVGVCELPCYATKDVRSGPATGPPGKAGPTGESGLDGIPGTSGVDGIPGTPGVDGTHGTPGVDGTPGLPGQIGPPGAKGDAADCSEIREELEIVKDQLNETIQRLNELENVKDQLNETIQRLNELENVKDQLNETIKDCSRFYSTQGETVTDIYPFGFNGQAVKAKCDMTTSPGGWTIIQKRVDGTENFNRNWQDYVSGFGSSNHEYWLGLDALYELTKAGDQMLRIDLEDRQGNIGHAIYSTFSVGSSTDNYRLNVGGYEGNIGDSLRPTPSSYNLNGMMFSTKDEDNDVHDSAHCAEKGRGGWWYNSCLGSNLNGDYSINDDWKGVVWHYWHDDWRAMAKTQMMITKRN